MVIAGALGAGGSDAVFAGGAATGFGVAGIVAAGGGGGGALCGMDGADTDGGTGGGIGSDSRFAVAAGAAGAGLISVAAGGAGTGGGGGGMVDGIGGTASRFAVFAGRAFALACAFGLALYLRRALVVRLALRLDRLFGGRRWIRSPE